MNIDVFRGTSNPLTRGGDHPLYEDVVRKYIAAVRHYRDGSIRVIMAQTSLEFIFRDAEADRFTTWFNNEW